MDYLPHPRVLRLPTPQSESGAFPLTTLHRLWVQMGAPGSSRSCLCAPVPLTVALAAGCLTPQLPLVGTRIWCNRSSCVDRDGPLWVSSGHEKAIETQRGTKDRGHLVHTHACSWCVPRGGVRSEPEAGWGARGNVCQAQGRSGQPLSSGCLLPTASLRTVRGWDG